MRRIKRLQSFVKIFSECHTITLREEITQKQKKKLLEIREGNTTTITSGHI
jgi:ribosomal protein S21